MKEVLRAARLFEPDRNEEKRTNEHAEKTKQKNLGPLRKLCHFMIGYFRSQIISMLVSVLIACVFL